MTTTAVRPTLSRLEAADYLGVTERTISAYIKQGTLPAFRVRDSRLIRIRPEDLEALMERIPASPDAS